MGTKDAYDPVYKSLVDDLIARRKALGVTQAQLAALMGTDQSQISKFERRERRIDVIDFLRYCVALQLDPGDVLTETQRSLKVVRSAGGA